MTSVPDLSKCDYDSPSASHKLQKMLQLLDNLHNLKQNCNVVELGIKEEISTLKGGQHYYPNDLSEATTDLENISELPSYYSHLSSAVNCQNNEISRLENQVSCLRKEFNTVTYRLREEEEKRKTAFSGLSNLKSLLEDLRTAFNRLNTDHLHLKSKFGQFVSTLDEVSGQVEIIRSSKMSASDTTDNGNDVLEIPSYLPTDYSPYYELRWAITNFSRKHQAAKDNGVIYKSPVFFSKPNGYKLQGNAFLNGIGMWTGKVTLFDLKILDSPWNCLLKWPCNIDITLTLVDQNPVRSKVRHHFNFITI